MPATSFNFTDLAVTPVPWDVYFSQPRCCLGFDNPCDSSLPYAPILSIPLAVRSLDPAWVSCVGKVDGVWDPPHALMPQPALPTPTAPKWITSVPASPGNSPLPNAASNTAVAIPETRPSSIQSLALPEDSNSSTGPRASSQRTAASNEDTERPDPPSAPANGSPSHLTFAKQQPASTTKTVIAVASRSTDSGALPQTSSQNSIVNSPFTSASSAMAPTQKTWRLSILSSISSLTLRYRSSPWR